MSSNRTLRLPGLVLAVLSVVGIAQILHGQTKPESHDSMPGMDMPAHSTRTPKPGPATPPGYTEVKVTTEVQQRIGVTVGTVEQTPLEMTMRTVGIVQSNETRVAHIHVKTEGWVDRLYVSYTGQHVKAGDPLLSIYSPVFFSAQQEFLTALRASKADLGQPEDQKVVLDTARRRLELWDIPADEIDQLARSGQPRKSLTLRSPISGTVMEKQAFAGQYVTSQSDLYVVADLSSVWMQARIFQSELTHVALGMPATVSFQSGSGRTTTGKIVFIDPVMDEISRSAQVRIELPNASGQLRPGMFGDVSIGHAMGKGLTVPTSAIIRTGERDIAFRVVAADRFAPVAVKINPIAFGDRFQVLDGLNAGDRVVTSANFLIDSESRLEAGASSMADMPGMSAAPKSDTTANLPAQP